MKWMTCPFCGLATYGDPCATRLVCNACSAEVNNGQVVSKGIGRKNALGRQRRSQEVASTIHKAEKRIKSLDAKKAFGTHVEERMSYSVGGAEILVFDRRSDTAIAKKTSKGFAAL